MILHGGDFMKITILGYYGGYPSKDTGTTGYLVQTRDTNLLLDAGSATLLELEKHLDPLDLDAVLLTHYHHDHTADLGVLQYRWQLNEKKRLTTLPIYGHTEDPLNFGALTWPNASKGVAYQVNDVIKIGGMQITFKKTEHPVAAFATRIEEVATGKVFTFTSDTRYFAELAEFAKDSDLLITDTNFLNEHQGAKWHLTTKETAELFDKAHAKHLIISHLSPQIDPKLMLEETQRFSMNPSEIELPATGKVIEL